MATPPVPSLPPPSLFTLSPAHLAGRRALKGFQFQTTYIMYVLAGLAAGKEDFAAARIEAVEDLDALVRGEGIWIKRYYQIKSKQEGAGSWTLNLLDREGVLTQFFNRFRVFQSRKPGGNRRIELVLAVEGDLGDEPIQLRDQGRGTSDTRATLFGILCSNVALSLDPVYEPAIRVIRDWCKANSGALSSGTRTAALDSSEFNEFVRSVSDLAQIPFERTRQTLAGVVNEVAAALDDFILSLKFDSRLGRQLDEATLARLIETGDLSPDEALTASDRLRRSIEDESVLPTPTDIDHAILREWLGVPERAVLQTKPPLSPNSIKREELLDDLSRVLQTDHVVLFHGLSKVGKSQLVSALVDYAHREDSYFWFTFSGDAGDLD